MQAERYMQLVNILLCLTLCLRIPLLIVFSYGAWLGFLVCQRKRTDSRGMRMFYGALAVFASAIILLNLCFLFRRFVQ